MSCRAKDWVSPLAIGAALATLACSGNDADVRVGSVRSLGVLPTPSGIVGRDGGVSGRFQGRSVWVYGDSVTLDAGTYPNTWRNNSMSWTDDLDASDGIDELVQPRDETGAPREFFPRTEDEEAFNAQHLDHGDGRCEAIDGEPCGARIAIWGSGPVQDVERGRALLSYGKVHAAPGEFNFSIVGTSLAVWTDFEKGPTRPLVAGTLEDPRLLFTPEEGEFAIPVAHDGFLYLFSCSGAGPAAHTCRLARAELDHVLERAAWRFRGVSARDWIETADGAASLFQGSPNMTVHFNEQIGRWLALYISWGQIVLRTAPELGGPWSDEVQVFQPPEDNALHALAHSEFQERRGAVEYVSYLADNRFHLLRVELSRP